MKTKIDLQNCTLGKKVCEIFDDNKADDIVLIDVVGRSSITDYFAVCTANSTVHAKSIAGKIEDELEALGTKVLRRDGMTDGRWIVLDFGELIVHIFTNEIRELYNIEKIWSDGKNCFGYLDLKAQGE